MEILHKSVLLEEIIKYLNPGPGNNFIDCTLGDGGHALEVLRRISPDGQILGIDFDSAALETAQSRIEEEGLNRDRIKFYEGNFADLGEIIQKTNFPKADGIVMDLGLRTEHLETSGRGFSFQKDEPLDMRFGTGGDDLIAAEIVNSWPKDDLEWIFREYGEEKKAWKIAEAIVRERKRNRILTSKELADLILAVIPRKPWEKIHPATRVFQALRIAVNDELKNLEKVLPQAVDALKSGGRLAVISFHSLEDRIVKHYFKENNSLKILTKRPLTPSEEEIARNPKSRSAKLRVAEKI
jgi:16S rRNA (cytosine1402-N4)-methyltransferase